MIFDHAARDPDGIALDDGTRQRSWAGLVDRATRIARFLRDDVGLPRNLGDRRLEVCDRRVTEMPCRVVLAIRLLRHVLAEALLEIVHGRGGARIHRAVVGAGQTVPRVLPERVGGTRQRRDHPFEREHVTPFVRDRPERFRLEEHLNPDGDWSALRWTVDETEDLRRGVWNKKEYSKARGLKGRTLGIVGLGRIGYEVAKRAAAFKMRLFYTDVVDQKKIEQELGIRKVPFKQLLAEADFVTLHVPGGEGTRHLIG